MPISPTTLRADISRWTNSSSWGDQFTAALALLKNDGAGGFTISKDWYDDFFDAMGSAEGDIGKACELACVDVRLVLAVSGDKRSKHYDADFVDRLRIAEAPVHFRIRKNVLRMAEQESGDGAKLGLKVLENAAPALHAPKQQVEVSGEVDHRHQHDHRVRMLPAAVVAASAHRNRTIRAAIAAGAEDKLTIDVTPQRQRAVAGGDR